MTEPSEGAPHDDVARRARRPEAMKIEVLYFDGCPSYMALRPRLRELLADAGAPGNIELRRVESPQVAEAERFLGSPTVRIDGADVEPGAAERSDFGLKCRLFRTPEGSSPTPPDDWLRAALERRRDRLMR